MANRVQKEQVQLELIVDGKKVENTIKDLTSAQKKLNTIIRESEVGSKNFVNASKKMKIVKERLAEARAAARSFQQEQKGMTGMWGKIGNSFKKFFSPMAAALAGFSLVSAVGEIFTLGTELEAFDRKSKQVFGGAISDVEQFATQNARAMGLSRKEYVATATAAGDLLIPMGFQRKEAAELSAGLINLSGALSEWTGGQKDSKEVSEILTKALLGEREQLKTLGISIQEADVKQRLMEKGQAKLTGSALQQAKAMATLELITEKSADAQAAYADNTGSLVRQQAKLKASWADTKDTIANAFIPAMSSAMGWINNLIGASSKYSDQMEQERNALNVLVYRITNVNNSNEERKNLIEKLNRQYPDFLGNLDAEKATNEEIAIRMKEVNDQLINKIILQSREEEIAEANEKAAQKRKARIGSEDFGIELLIAAQEKYGFTLKENTKVAEQLSEAVEKIKNDPNDLPGKSGDIEVLKLSYEVLLGAIADEQHEQKKVNELLSDQLKLRERLGITGKKATPGKKSGSNQKTADKEREKLDKQELEARKQIERLKVELMAEGEDKQIALIELKAKERLDALKDSAGDSEELLTLKARQRVLIEHQTQREIARVKDDFAGKEVKRLQEEAQAEIAALQGNADEVLTARTLIEQQLKTDVSQVITANETEQIRILKDLAELRKEAITVEGEDRKSLEKSIEVQLTEDIETVRKESYMRIAHSDEVARKARLTETQKAFEAELEKEKEFLKEKEILHLQAAVIKITEGGEGVDQKAVQAELDQALIDMQIAFLEKKKELQQQFGLSSLETEKQIEQLKLGLTKDRLSEEQKLENEARQKRIQNYQSVLNEVGSLLNNLSQINNASLSKELSRLDTLKQRELDQAQDNADAKRKIEEKFDKQREAAEIKAAKTEKDIALGKALINVALAVTKALSAAIPPFNIPLMIQAAAQGAIQIAAITAQTFAQGGMVQKDGDDYFYEGRKLKKRGSFSPGGPVESGTLGVIGERGPEWVAPNWMLNHPEYGPVIKFLESVRTGATGSANVHDGSAESTPGSQLGQLFGESSSVNLHYPPESSPFRNASDGIGPQDFPQFPINIPFFAAGGQVSTTPADPAVLSVQASPSNDALMEEIRGLKEALGSMQFVALISEKNAADIAALNKDVEARRLKTKL